MVRAFVNYTILLDFYYGVRDNKCRQMVSYLTDKQQCLKVNDKYSEYKKCTYWCPQGPILGLLLFILYVNRVVR